MLSYLYARIDLTISALALADLLKRSDLNLEHVSTHITDILLNENVSTVNKQVLLKDIEELVSLSEFDHDLQTVMDEVEMLLEEIRRLISRHRLHLFGRMRSVHLQAPNTVVIEFYSRGVK